MKKRWVLLTLLIFVLVLSSCSSPSKEGPAQQTKTEETQDQESTDSESASSSKNVEQLIIGTLAKNEVFNSQMQSDAFGRMNYNCFTQGNFAYVDENNVLQPFFFQSFDISEDGKEIVFTFPLDAVWHDGQPVTADDITFTFDYMKNVKQVGSLANLESWNIEGNNTCRLVFSEPDAYYWINSSAMNTSHVYPKHIWEGITDYESYTNEDAAVGCGPYKLTKVDKDSQTSYYEAVPENHYAGDMTVKSIVIQTYADDAALMMALNNGEIDALFNYAHPIDAQLMETTMGVEGIDPGESDYMGHFQMTYGMERAPGQDLEFRKAVRSALDYDKLATVINGQYGQAPGAGIIAPPCKGFDETLPILKRDLDLANKILDDAGYVDADGDGFRDMPDGTPLDVMVTPQFSSKTQELHNRIADTIMISLKDVNIKSHIDEDSLRNSEVWEKNISDGKYDLSIGYTTPGMAHFTSAFRYFLADPQFEGEKTWIWGTYHNDEFKDTYFAMVKAVSDEQYIENIKKLQKMANDEVYAQALCWQKSHFPYRTDKYEGWKNYPSWGVIHPRTWYELTTKE